MSERLIPGSLYINNPVGQIQALLPSGFYLNSEPPPETPEAIAFSEGKATVVGISLVASAGSSSGTSTAIGISEVNSVMFAEGQATTTGIGRLYFSSVGNANGEAHAIGISEVGSDAHAEGKAIVFGESDSIQAPTGFSEGKSIAKFYAPPISSDGLSTRLNSLWPGRTKYYKQGILPFWYPISSYTQNIQLKQIMDLFFFGVFDSGSVADSAGTSIVVGFSTVIISSTGTSNGQATVTGVGDFLLQFTAHASGQATVDGIGAPIITGYGAGNAIGQATVDGIGAAIYPAVGMAAGMATANAPSTEEGVAFGFGQGSVNGIGRTYSQAVANSSGQATANAFGVAWQQIDAIANSNGQATVMAIDGSYHSGDGTFDRIRRPYPAVVPWTN